MKKILSIVLLVALVATMAVATSAGSLGKKFADTPKVEKNSITVDGKKDDAYNGVTAIVTQTSNEKLTPIGNIEGSMAKSYVVWDGSALYIYSEIKDASPYVLDLTHMMSDPSNNTRFEMFLVYNNSDCPNTVRYYSDSDVNLYQYAISYNSDPNYVWVDNLSNTIGTDGFVNAPDYTDSPFVDEPGFVSEAAVSTTASGYNVEVKINLPAASWDGTVDYTYGDGTEIGIAFQIIDKLEATANHDYNAIIFTDPSGVLSDEDEGATMEYVWQPQYFGWIVLQGEGSVSAPDTDNTPADTTANTDAAPKDTSKAPADNDAKVTDPPADTKNNVADKAPQTSDVAVAGVAILATLALAGVVVAKKVK